MFKFDVRYNFDVYYDYYKDVLVKSKIKRDIVFAIIFVAIAIYWWIDTSDSTAGNTLPIFATIMGITFPLMNFISLPSLKKQLKARQADIDRTHIMVTFEDDKIVYDNLSEPKPEEVKNEVKEETKIEENPVVEETKEDIPEKVEETKPEENKVEEPKPEENKEEQRTFELKYENFGLVKEVNLSILFYLDRQTIIIIPKSCIEESSSLEEFKQFILTKLPKRCKFIKAKKVK